VLLHPLKRKTRPKLKVILTEVAQMCQLVSAVPSASNQMMTTVIMVVSAFPLVAA
jgi:hypothetical protein